MAFYRKFNSFNIDITVYLELSFKCTEEFALIGVLFCLNLLQLVTLRHHWSPRGETKVCFNSSPPQVVHR